MRKYLTILALALSQESMGALGYTFIKPNEPVDEDVLQTSRLQQQALRDEFCQGTRFPPNIISAHQMSTYITTVNLKGAEEQQWQQKVKVKIDGYCLNGKFSSNKPIRSTKSSKEEPITVTIPVTPGRQ